MGLLDFLKRGRAKTRARPREPDQPRTQHYVFAHVALKEVAFADPVTTVGLLHGPRAVEFLNKLWDDVAEKVRQTGEPADVDASGLAVQPQRVGEFPCAIVHMPPALEPAEAHLVGLVLHVKLGSGEPPPDSPELSYFTLERGITLDGGERTVLCAWTREGQHLNFGDGPAVQDEAFGKAIQDILAGRGEVHASFQPPGSQGPGGAPQT
jgi:hypothetical protein